MAKKLWKKFIALLKWLWNELKDWHTLVLFCVVFIVMSSEIWLPYLLALIIGVETEIGITLISIASACWLFWLGPMTPFLELCILITLGLKKLYEVSKKRIKLRKHIRFTKYYYLF